MAMFPGGAFLFLLEEAAHLVVADRPSARHPLMHGAERAGTQLTVGAGRAVSPHQAATGRGATVIDHGGLSSSGICRWCFDPPPNITACANCEGEVNTADRSVVRDF